MKEGQDIHEASAAIMNCDGIASVTAYEDMRTRFGSMMESMDDVVLVISVCAGAIACMVMYNLTNLKNTTRLREDATTQVRGVYRKGTEE